MSLNVHTSIYIYVYALLYKGLPPSIMRHNLPCAITLMSGILFLYVSVSNKLYYYLIDTYVTFDAEINVTNVVRFFAL